MPTKKKKKTAAKGKAKSIVRAKGATKKKGVVSKTKRAKTTRPQARSARVKRKDLPLAARKAVTHASTSTCGQPCRVCGSECSRGGLHEQHRCRDHVGISA